MRIVIVGPGAIGCAIAFRLVETDHEVTLLDYRADRAATLSRHGLFLDEKGATRSVPIQAVSEAGPPPAAVIFLCVKSYSTAAAGMAAKAAVGPDTTVVSLQNGIGNAECLITEAGLAPASIVCAVTTMGSTLLRTGHVRLVASGSIALAPFSTASAAGAERVASLLDTSGFDVHRRDVARDMIWSKAVLNAAINPVSALAGVPNGEIPKRLDLRRQMIASSCEGETVARAAGIRLDYDDAAVAAQDLCDRTRDNVSSMLQDIRSGRRTEVDAINGAIVREAGTFGVPTPVNGELMQAIHALECKG
jgi:2-dehydropantoate 2-reductase